MTGGCLLRVVTRHGALFPHGFMTGEAINERIRVIGLRAGLRDAHRLTAHGLRSGPASAAAKRGSPLSAIAEQGRWSPNSPGRVRLHPGSGPVEPVPGHRPFGLGTACGGEAVSTRG